MKISTAYSLKPSHDYEALDYLTDMCDGSQYMSVNEIVRRTIRGETLDIHDYSSDNWIDACDNFDVMDMYLHRQREEESEEPPQEDQKTSPQEEQEAPPQE